MEHSTSNEVGVSNLIGNVFLNRISLALPKFMLEESYEAEEIPTDIQEFETFYVDKGSKAFNALCTDGETLGYVSISWGKAHFQVASSGEEQAVAMMERLKILVPKQVVDDPALVPVTFWALGPNGPWSVRRTIDVPAWNDIQINYNEKTLEPLKELITEDYRPGRGGQLILWHGEPGTGKTTAIRALANEWRSWADIHYIVDPEKFFGQESAYMMQVMMHVDYDSDEKNDPRWKLLILEDCGELLTPDARALSGQGLSRFLNAVDGLIGQGLRIAILVTTNEEVSKLHPAVQRPGRCAYNISFEKLTNEEVRNWLTAHNSTFNKVTSMPIADLYAAHEGRSKKIIKSVGFGVE